MSNNPELLKMFQLLQEAYLATLAKMDSGLLAEPATIEHPTQDGPIVACPQKSDNIHEDNEMAAIQFNSAAIEPSAPMGQLSVSGPEGHPVIISASEIKQSKSGGNNGYVEFQLTVIDGPHKGEAGAYRLNIYHENPQVVSIAQSQLSAICHVTGRIAINDTNELHNIPFRCIVGNQKPDPKNPDGPVYTEVKSVLDINGNKPSKNMAQPQATNQPQFAAQPAPVQQYAAQPVQQAYAQPAPAQQFAPAPQPVAQQAAPFAPQQQFQPTPGVQAPGQPAWGQR